MIDDKPVFTGKQRKSLFRFIQGSGFSKKLYWETVTYSVPELIIRRFIKDFVILLNTRGNIDNLKRFLLKFGFTEFMPGVSLMPEAIIEIKRKDNIYYTANFDYGAGFEKKWGKMYFYQYYDKGK